MTSSFNLIALVISAFGSAFSCFDETITAVFSLDLGGLVGGAPSAVGAASGASRGRVGAGGARGGVTGSSAGAREWLKGATLATGMFLTCPHTPSPASELRRMTSGRGKATLGGGGAGLAAAAAASVVAAEASAGGSDELVRLMRRTTMAAPFWLSPDSGAESVAVEPGLLKTAAVDVLGAV